MHRRNHGEETIDESTNFAFRASWKLQLGWEQRPAVGLHCLSSDAEAAVQTFSNGVHQSLIFVMMGRVFGHYSQYCLQL
jgi:hypothetical protein